MGSAAQFGGVSTFLWLGDSGRPTYGVVEHFSQWRWPELHPGAEHHHQLRQWRLYTLDHQPTVWPLADYWLRAGHLEGDFLVWDATPYRPYEVVFIDNILCSGHATQSADPTVDTWESPTLQRQTRQYELTLWAVRLAMLGAAYVLTSGTAPTRMTLRTVMSSPISQVLTIRWRPIGGMPPNCLPAGMSGSAIMRDCWASICGLRALPQPFGMQQFVCPGGIERRQRRLGLLTVVYAEVVVRPSVNVGEKLTER
jgi:hypothetical protein